MNSYYIKSLQTLFVLVFIVLFISSCSSSDSSNTDGDQLPADSEMVVASIDAANSNAGATAIESQVEDDTDADNSTETVDENGVTGEQAEPEPSSPVSSPDENNSAVEDPLIQNSVPVSFEITVPQYQSEELRVEVVWGDMNLTAMWVGDELWSASADFPTDTENELSVTFYDGNGDIELATHSRTLRTAANATESIQITADQFDAGQFDTDEDGISNLDELVAGTDPSIDEDSLLPIVEFIGRLASVRMTVSEDFESRLTQERPLFETYEPGPGNPTSISGDLDIDAQGNGTLTHNRRWGAEFVNIAGTRTRSEDAITWEGTRSAYDGNDYYHNVEFSNTVTVIDESTRRFVEETFVTNSGTNSFDWTISSNLTGRLIDGRSVCEFVAGTVFIIYSTNDLPRQRRETTVTKELDDPYWRVVSVTDFFAQEPEPVIETNEYFARELRMSSGDDQEESGFICDFVDF